jgi:hypothetical protein
MIAFSVGGSQVSADRETRYRKAKCDRLRDGDSVHVTGLPLANGVIAATEIQLNKD